MGVVKIFTADFSFLHESWSVDSQKNLENCCHDMSIFRLICSTVDSIRQGLHPYPIGELTALPRPSSCTKGALLLRGGRNMESE